MMKREHIHISCPDCSLYILIPVKPVEEVTEGYYIRLSCLGCHRMIVIYYNSESVFNPLGVN